MTDEAKVRELFAPIVERPIDVEGREFRVDREAAIGAILAAPQSHSPRSRQRGAVVWGAGVAACLALAASVLVFVGQGTPSALAPTVMVHAASGAVAHWQAGKSHALEASAEPRGIESNGELTTGAKSSARIKNTQGAEVALFENSRLVLSGFDLRSSSVQLLAGSIRCDVPLLRAGQRFSVVTPQGRVEVRGTAFTVLVSGMADAARTCVKVERGSAVVKTAKAESHIGAGESWGCEPVSQPSTAVGLPEQATEAPSPSAKGKPLSQTLEREEQKAKTGTLDEENRLFQAGLAAERQRNLQGARAAFDELLARFPGSPLADDARVARQRVGAQAPKP